MSDQRGMSLLALLLALAILGLGVWFLVSRTASDGVDALAGAGLQLDETQRQRTLADMKAIGDALRLMQADTGAYPAMLSALRDAGHLAVAPTADAWGNAWTYQATDTGFELRSLGADGRPGPPPPDPWSGGAYACDLVMVDGVFTQAPASR